MLRRSGGTGDREYCCVPESSTRPEVPTHIGLLSTQSCRLRPAEFGQKLPILIEAKTKQLGQSHSGR
jgi:hypothetical protein